MLSEKNTITQQVYEQICNTIGCYPAETGGILGSSDGGNTIDHYYFDHSAHTTDTTYSPNTEVLNRVIAMWNVRGVELVGFIHSHPTGNRSPSAEDYQYVQAIMEALDVHDRFFMPIINVSDPPDGRVKIYSYIFERRLRMRQQRIAIARESGLDRFERISSIYPLEAMHHKTVICIGCGGTRQFIEELARSGVGNFILIDGDTVAATNIATQQVYSSEIGMSKAEAIRERIADINPAANVTAIPRFLDDTMTDNEFASIVGRALADTPKDVLICGCTDSFKAQGRSAALAMKYGTPYLAAQLYRGGMAAEIYFSYPGVTNSSCPRCAMSSRYEAYAEGYKNDVTSHGSPIFATTRVNAAKGQIALILLLYGETADCVYSGMLDQVADRNFVMIRMNPLANSALGIGIFNEVSDNELSFFDETVWIPQEPNTEPPCPLCGGTGDLLALKDTLRDTRTDWGCRS